MILHDENLLIFSARSHIFQQNLHLQLKYNMVFKGLQISGTLPSTSEHQITWACGLVVWFSLWANICLTTEMQSMREALGSIPSSPRYNFLFFLLLFFWRILRLLRCIYSVFLFTYYHALCHIYVYVLM